MNIKELLITGGWSERRKMHYRPLWQIVILAPLYLVYLPTSAFVAWMDRR